MKIPTLILAVLIFMGTPATAQAPEESKFRIPVLVKDVLDVCGEALNVIDTHPTQVTATSMIKYGWCMGWVQALAERVVEVHAYTQFEEMKAKKEGRPPIAYQGADAPYMNICFPTDLRIPSAALIREILEHLPGQVGGSSEPKNGPVKAALRQAYPCPAPAKQDAAPPDAKP